MPSTKGGGWLERRTTRSQERIDRKRVGGRNLLMPAKELHRIIEPFVSSDDQLIGVFPGTNTILPKPQRPMVELPNWLCVLWRVTRIFAINHRHVVGVTESAVFVWQVDVRGVPLRCVMTSRGHSSLGPLHATGDPFIEVGAHRYWIGYAWIDEVRRIERVLGRR